MIHDLIFHGQEHRAVDIACTEYRPALSEESWSLGCQESVSRHYSFSILQQRIMANLGIPEARITVIPNAIGDFWFQEREKGVVPIVLTS